MSEFPHERFIQRAIELAANVPNFPFGAVIDAEPCPICQGTILWSDIGLVVYGTSIRFLQNHGWRQIDILAEEVLQRRHGLSKNWY